VNEIRVDAHKENSEYVKRGELGASGSENDKHHEALYHKTNENRDRIIAVESDIRAIRSDIHKIEKQFTK